MPNERTSTPTQQKRIFISYTHSDSRVAQKITNELESLGMKPWIDSREIGPGQSFLERMNEGIAEASYILVLFSKDSHASRWVSREWMSALANKDTLLIPIILDDTPLPPLIRDIRYIDLRADVNEGVREVGKFFLLENSSGKNQQQQQQQRQQQQQQQQQQHWPGGPQQQQQQQQWPGYPQIDHQRQLYLEQTRQARGREEREHPLRSANRRQIRLVAKRCVDTVALRSYCFDTKIEYEDLVGSNLEDRLVSLLHKLDLEQELSRFVTWLENERGKCVSAQITALSNEPAWSW